MFGKTGDENGVEVVSSEIFEQEFNQCRGIVYSMMGRYYLKGYDEDDWLQEGRLVYWKSRESFDASQGISLFGYFSINFRRHIISLFRAQKAKKRNGGLATVSLEEVADQHGKGITSANASIMDETEGVVLRDLLEDFSKGLSGFELVVWLNLLLGKSVEEISESAELTVMQVNNAIDRVKRKMRVVL